MVTTGKNGSTGGGQAAYCLERTRGRVAYFFLGLLLLFLAFCLGTYGVMELGADRTGWELEDYAKLAVGIIGGLGLLAAGLYECYTSLRDFLQPGKSTLARSIRSQLPVPEEAPDWRQLFAMVDDDLRKNGRWFGKVGVGSDWLLGDEACALARVRGVFRHYEVHVKGNGNGNTRRTIDLLLIDDRKNSFVTSFQDVRDLDAVIQYLRLRIPAAFFGGYNDYIGYCGGSEEEWDRKEREFRQRQARQAERAQSQPIPAPAGPGFMLTDVDGQRTSRVTAELLAREMERLAPGQQLLLTATPPIPAGMKQLSPTVTEVMKTLNCVCRSDTTVMVAAILGTEGPGASEQLRGFGLVEIPKAQALEVMTRVVESHAAPDVFGPGWQALNVQTAPEGDQDQRHPPYLNITDGAGVSRRYERFSRRDVELAAQKVAEGSYRSAILSLPPRLVFLDGGDKSDARTTIQIALPKDGDFRVYREKTTGRQAAEWFVGCLEGRLPEGFDRWREVTKEWDKRVERMEKEKKNANKK